MRKRFLRCFQCKHSIVYGFIYLAMFSLFLMVTVAIGVLYAISVLYAQFFK